MSSFQIIDPSSSSRVAKTMAAGFAGMIVTGPCSLPSGCFDQLDAIAWRREASVQTSSHFAIELPESSSEQTADVSPKDKILSALSYMGLIPTRVRPTADEGHLLEYLDKVKACVDIYPEGDVVLIVERGDKDIYYSLNDSDVALIGKILKDVGV